VELPTLKNTLVSIRTGLKGVQELLENIQQQPRDPSDKFLNIFGEWQKASQKRYDQLEASFREAERNYDFVCQLYAEDSKILMPGEFYNRIQTFITAYHQAKYENEQAVIRQHEAEKKERDRQVRLFIT
jgi:hypothetical protein